MNRCPTEVGGSGLYEGTPRNPTVLQSDETRLTRYVAPNRILKVGSQTHTPRSRWTGLGSVWNFGGDKRDVGVEVWSVRHT